MLFAFILLFLFRWLLRHSKRGLMNGYGNPLQHKRRSNAIFTFVQSQRKTGQIEANRLE